MANILVCDDDKDIVEAIEIYLTQEGYHILKAYDGQEALDILNSETVDLLIIDVMMPRLDGIRATVKIRESNPLPIIILSAKSEDTDKILGLNIGADDYITKPFSATYLQARVENLLIQRKKLQSFYRDSLMHINMSVTSGELPASTKAMAEEEKKIVSEREEEQTQLQSQQQPTIPDMSPNDRKFMDKLVELMEQNMDNGELVVDDLVRELAVSRSVFFKKLKTLTGLAPIEFIKEIRIKRATQLIETGEFNMTQISYMVGINDPRYFSKCFKAQVGMTPTEYKEKVGR